MIGIFIYLMENYDLILKDGLKVLSKKKNLKRDRLYRYKILISVLALVLGIFRMLSWIIY